LTHRQILPGKPQLSGHLFPSALVERFSAGGEEGSQVGDGHSRVDLGELREAAPAAPPGVRRCRVCKR